MYYNKEQEKIMNAYIIVDILVCLGFQLSVKVTDYFGILSNSWLS